MILPDTSCWIDWVRNPDLLAQTSSLFGEFVTCGPVLQEVLQGLHGGPYPRVRESLLAIPLIADPTPLDMFLRAAEIYREGRRRGYTIRSAIDCLIAAIAIEHGATVWHKDRDFSIIARYTPLRVRSECLN